MMCHTVVNAATPLDMCIVLYRVVLFNDIASNGTSPTTFIHLF